MSSWPLIYVPIVLVIFNLYSTCPGDLKSISLFFQETFNLYSTCPGDLKSISLLSRRPLIYILLVLEIFNLFSSCPSDVKSTGCPTKHDSCWIVLNIFFHILYETLQSQTFYRLFLVKNLLLLAYFEINFNRIWLQYTLFCFILVGIKQLNKLWKKSCSKCLTPINPFRPVSIQV